MIGKKILQRVLWEIILYDRHLAAEAQTGVLDHFASMNTQSENAIHTHNI